MKNRTNTATWYPKYGYWKINVQKDGERRSFYSSIPGRTGQREANRKADLWLDDNINPTGAHVETVYAAFQAECEQTYSKTEYHHVDSIGRCWIVPYLGKKKITALCDGDIQKMLDKAAALGRSRKTIQDINGITNKFLKWCRKNKLTTYRPDDVQIPAGARYNGKQVLQPDDLKILFSVSTTAYRGQIVEDEFIHAYRLQVLTGLRPGELRGLRIEDFDGERLYIRRSINRYGDETQGKNQNAIRSFVLSEHAKKELQAQLSEYPSKDYIFHLPHESTYNERWQRYCETNGLTKTTPYELRHTFVSIAKTLPAGEIKPLVGHSQSMDTFGVYGHALEGEDTVTASKIDALFNTVLKGK